MNKTIVGIALTTILVFSILFAFLFVQGFFSSPGITAASSNVENGLQLFVTLDTNKTSFAQGENISITLALINTSNQTKSITDVNGNSIFDFEVYYDHNNNWVFAYYVGAPPIINQTITISPKANYNETFTWEQDGTFGHPSQEPVGTYYIEGAITDNGFIPSLQTPRLTIVIKYPLVEVATVFLIAIIAVTSFDVLLYKRHRKTANLNQ